MHGTSLSLLSPSFFSILLLNLTEFIFRSLYELLDVVLAFLISILKIFKSLQNVWHRVTDITSFEKRLESSSGHTLNFCLNLVQYRSGLWFTWNRSPGLLLWSCLQTQEGQRRSEFHLVGLENNEMPATSSVWPNDHREDYTCRSCARPFYSLVQISPKALHSD